VIIPSSNYGNNNVKSFTIFQPCLMNSRVHPFLPTSKEADPNIALDRDDKKLDVYLGLHKTSLLVSTMYVFLPFTISLDPQLRKEITG